MKQTILEWLLFAIAYIALVIGVESIVQRACGAEAIVATTTTAAGITVIDASKSTGKLTWRIQGEHEILFDGRVAVCRFANFTGALAAVDPDGSVNLILLHDRDDAPPQPPDATLTDKVRTLAKGLPADERKVVAAIHADAASQLRTITGSDTKVINSAIQAIVTARSARIKAALTGSVADWGTFFQSLSGLLRDERLSPVDPQAQAVAYEQIAGGLK